MWSPDGNLFGVAYSKYIVHIYSFAANDLRNHLEIEAHVDSVNDLAFSFPSKLCVVTYGEDRLIKVWDALIGGKLYAFEGHEAPVYSVCPHHKENIQIGFWALHCSCYGVMILCCYYYCSGKKLLTMTGSCINCMLKIWKVVSHLMLKPSTRRCMRMT
ncbi:hypothetical protein Droror1_Dr00027332 [Drosera rotundifolia]